MKKFVILGGIPFVYETFILCLTSDSIYEYIDKIEAELNKHNGYIRNVLIDMLFITGNGKNRFMGCERSINGKLNLTTSKIINPPSYFKQKTVEWLHDNYSYVENSILTDEQRRKIKNNIMF